MPRRRDPRRPPANTDEVIVEGVVRAIVPGGLAILDHADGVVFARGGLPGERVVVRVARKQGGTRHGVVVDVKERSALRVVADCAAHPECGGCDLLDMAYAGHADVKRAIVVDALRRIGKLDAESLARVGETRSPPTHAEHRRRARFIVDDAGHLTFHARASDRTVAFASCRALAPRLEAARLAASALGLPRGVEVRLAVDDRGRAVAALDEVDDDARRIVARRLVDAGAVDGALLVDNDEQVRASFGDPTLAGEIAPGTAGGPYASDAATFTQATRFGATAISDAVVAAVAPRSGLRVLELFAGAGHLTLPLAAAGATVVAVEGAARSFHHLVENAARPALCGRVAAHRAFIGADGGPWASGRFDVVVADPPRTGVPGFAGLLQRLDTDRLVLVSCDPATGARDVATARACGFALQALVPIDAFPRTSHVEWVATLTRVAASSSEPTAR